MFKPSQFQKAIFSAFSSCKNHTVVNAGPGTGKTTTLVNGLTEIPATAKVVCMAFNAPIADVLNQEINKKQIPGNRQVKGRVSTPANKKILKGNRIQASTLHSGGMKCVIANWGSVRVNKYRGWNILEAIIKEADPESFQYAAEEIQELREAHDPESGEAVPQITDTKNKGALRNLVRKLAKVVGYVKGVNVNPTEEEMEGYLLDKEVEPPEGSPYTLQTFAEWCILAMDKACERTGQIDFDDMIFLPVRLGLAKPSYDVVLIDEAQDMSPVQIKLARMLLNKGGKLFVIGDERQAIYSFRGADSEIMNLLQEELSADTLSLPVTYRCAKAIVAHAHIRRVCSEEFTAFEGAPEGSVRVDLDPDTLLKEAKAGDAILSRLNAPLSSLAMKFLKDGRAVQIKGQDIGAGFIQLIESFNCSAISDLFERLESWETAQCEKVANRRDADERIEAIQDKVAAISALAEGCETVHDLCELVRDLFAIGKKDRQSFPHILLSSVHKAKGLEWDVVWGLVDTLYNRGRTREEENIEHVMITRAKTQYNEVIGCNAKKGE